jgi:hypothetical protein
VSKHVQTFPEKPADWEGDYEAHSFVSRLTAKCEKCGHEVSTEVKLGPLSHSIEGIEPEPGGDE